MKNYPYLLKQYIPGEVSHTLHTYHFPTYIWFLAHIKNLKIGPYHPTLTTLLLKVLGTSAAVRGRSPSLGIRNVLGTVRYTNIRFYAKSAAFSALKKSQLKSSERLTTQSSIWFHTGVTWSAHYVNTLNYYKMIGIGPQRNRLADEIGTVNVLDKAGEQQLTIRNSSNTKSAARRLKTNVMVQQFLNYVRGRALGLNFAPAIRLRVAYKTLNSSKRNLGKTKGKLYQKPYAFIGLKKTPKSLVRNPFQTMFRRALRTWLASSKSIKLTNQRAGARSIYTPLNTDQFSKLKRFKSVSTQYTSGTRKSLGYWPKKLLKVFLRSCGSRLPARLPKFVTRRPAVISLVPKPYSYVNFTNLKLRSMGVRNTICSTYDNINLHDTKIKNRLDGSQQTQNSYYIKTSGSVLRTHRLRYSFCKALPRLSRAQLFQLAYSPFELSNRKAFLTFTSLLVGWCKRVRGVSRADLNGLKIDQYVRLSTLLSRSSYLLSKLGRIRYRKSIGPAVIRLWLGCFNKAEGVLVSAQSHLLLLPTLGTYPVNTSYRTYRTAFNLLKILRLNKRPRPSRQTLQPLRRVTAYGGRPIYSKTLTLLHKTTGSHIKLKKPINLAGYDLWQHVSVPLCTNLDMYKSLYVQPLNVNVSEDKLRLPVFRSKLPLTWEMSGAGYIQDHLKVRPLYTTSFTRSLFFFYNLFNLRNLNTYDLVTAGNDLHSRFTFNVFPTANDLKVSIFRRLNHQKLLAQSRILTLNSKSLFYKNTIYNQPPFTWPLKVGQHSFFRANTTNNSNYRAMLSSFNPSNRKNVRIRRVRFKPGYGRIWRQARSSIREILNIHAKYQYRLTPKLQIRYFQARKNERKFSTFDLSFALMTTNLAPDIWSTNEFLANGYVFLNGECHSNPSTKLFINDFIQLVVNVKFYIALRWLRNWSSLKLNRITKVFYRKFRPSAFNRNVKIVRELPTWFYGLQYTYCDVPKYFEVDYFTLSVFVIHNRLELEKWMPTRADLFSYEILNMYNWKYIT